MAVVGVLLALQYLVPDGGYEEVKTSKMVSHINSGEVKKITFVDGDQQIRATLDDGDKVTATWVSGQPRPLVNLVQKQIDQGEIEDYNVENPKPSFLGLIFSLLPIVLSCWCSCS